jgi:hypothetical protein
MYVRIHICDLRKRERQNIFVIMGLRQLGEAGGKKEMRESE